MDFNKLHSNNHIMPDLPARWPSTVRLRISFVYGVHIQYIQYWYFNIIVYYPYI